MSFWQHYLRLSNRILTQQTRQHLLLEKRDIKRWVAPTLKEIARRRKKIGPDIEKPRSSYLEWNYDMEINCFAKRVGEKFDMQILREAFIQREWANMERNHAELLGDNSFNAPSHNQELAQEGFKLICDYIKEIYAKLYPVDVVNGVCQYLTTDDMLAHIAKHLGIKDLIKSHEYPPTTTTLADAFKAVVGALSHSVEPKRVKLFVKDFVVCQMNGKDIHDVWVPEKPYDYLLKLLQERGIEEVEPRLCTQSAVNTILANYQVGLYNAKDKSCLGLGWGENIKIAKDTAALDAIQRIYSSYVSK